MNLQPAFILHSRYQGDSNLVLDLLTLSDGRVSALARGVRSEKSKSRAILQPFTPLLVRLNQGHGLRLLLSVEELAPDCQPKGKLLMCGYYINEVLMRALPQGEVLDGAFELYGNTLQTLDEPYLDACLRSFEFQLLDLLGMLPDFLNDQQAGKGIDPHLRYQFLPEQGFIVSDQGAYSGRVILSIANQSWKDAETLSHAKVLFRVLLQSVIGNKPLKSRRMFKKMYGAQ